jgi:hypothetical protein
VDRVFSIHEPRFTIHETCEAGMAALEATQLSFTLLADNPPKVQLLVTGLCLAAALLAGAGILALLNKWWRRRRGPEDLSPGAQLAQFRSLYEAGAISQEEFERLRNLLGNQMRQTLGIPAPAAQERIKPPPGENGQPPQPPPTGIRPA